MYIEKYFECFNLYLETYGLHHVPHSIDLLFLIKLSGAVESFLLRTI